MTNKQKLYWPPAVTIDTVIFTIDGNQLKALLIKRPNPPFSGYWALPGGFILKNETSRAAASRILKEKAGVTTGYLEQLYTFDSPGRDPRGHVLTVTYFALINKSKIKFDVGANIQMPIFHKVKKLPRLAFDHKKIIEYAAKRLRYKLEYTNSVFLLLPRQFTLSQLQRAYEIILGRKLDKRNFRKKFLALGLLNLIKRKIGLAGHRPARLYAFAKQKPLELKRFF